MITLVVLCLLTLELEGSLSKPISLPNMPSAAQKAAKAAAALKKLPVAPKPTEQEAPETVLDNSQAGLTASLFPETQVLQEVDTQEPTAPVAETVNESQPTLALSPDGQPRESMEAPHPPQPKDIVCI